MGHASIVIDKGTCHMHYNCCSEVTVTVLMYTVWSHASTLLPYPAGMSERLLTPTTTLEMRPQSQPSKQLVITITLSAVGVVIVCAIVFVITAAVVACVKKKGKYTFGSPRGRDEASESMTMNPLYHGWSTPPPNRSKPEMSTTMNAMCEPSRLRTPDTADRHASAASERLYASIHQRTMFQGHTVRSIGDPASTCSHIADDIETKMNEAYAANDLESFKITTPTPHSQSAYDYIVLQDT